MNEERAKDVIAKVFFDTLDENMIKADIAFKAYERGYADARKDIKEEFEKQIDSLSIADLDSVTIQDFYKSIRILICGEKIN